MFKVSKLFYNQKSHEYKNTFCMVTLCLNLDEITYLITKNNDFSNFVIILILIQITVNHINNK